MIAMRVLCEDCLRLDIGDPTWRNACNPARSNAGTVHWSYLGSDIASADFVWSNAGRVLTIGCVINGVAAKQSIKLVTTTPYFGGKRYWFVCPVSGRRARVLYLPPRGRTWASRSAFNLAYASQRTRTAW